MTSTRELKAKFTADTTQFNQQIKAADSTMKLLANQTRLLDAQMKSDGATTDMLESKKRTLTQSLEQNRIKQEALRAKVEEAKKSFGDESIEVERLSTQLATAKRKEVELASDLASTNTAIDRQKNAFSSLQASIAQQESKIDRAKTAYKALVVQYGEGSDKAQKVAQSIKRMDAELDDSRAKMAAAETAADRLGNEFDDAGDKAEASAKKYEAFGEKAKSAGDGMASAGRTLTGTVTAGIVAAGAATVVAATDIDTALTGVKKTVDGTEAEYQALKAAAIEFSQTNAVSPSQILDIQALGAQLGFGIDELSEFGEVVSGLDIATNMSADQAATEMAQFANITKMAHEDVSRYGSAIVGLGNNFATTESSISSMAMRIAAAGKQVGMSQADILGLSTALSSMGVEAEAGGSAISTIMSQIDKSVAKGSDGLKQWADAAGMSTSDFSAAIAENADQFKGLADSVGMTVKEFQGDVLASSGSLDEWAKAANMDAEQFAAMWKNEPVEALSDVLSGLEGATTEGSNMSLMLEQLGVEGIRQTDVMKRLAGNSELVGDAVAKSNEEWTKNTALQNEVDNKNDSLAAKFEILKNRVIAVADDVGGPLADSLLDVVNDAEPLIKAISDGAKAFNDMSKEQQQTILAAVGLVAAIGPVMSVTGNVTKLFGEGSKKLGGFQLQMGLMEKAAKSGKGELTGVAASIGGFASKTTVGTKAATGLAKAMGTASKAIPYLGAALMAFEAVSFVAELARANSEAGKLEKQFNENVKSSTAFSESYKNATARMPEADQLISASGQTVEQLNATVDAAESGITSILQQALQEQRGLRQEDVDSINGYNQQIADAYAQKTETYLTLMGTEAELTAQTMKNMSDEEIAQSKANIEAQGQAAIEAESDSYDRRRQNLAQQYNSGLMDEKDYNDQSAALRADHMAKVDEINGKTAESYKVIGDALSRAKEDTILAFGEMTNAAATETKKISNIYSENYGAMETLVGNQFVTADEFRAAWESMSESSKSSASNILESAGSIAESGGQMDEKMRIAVESILLNFDDLSGEAGDAGRDAMIQLAGGMEENLSGVSDWSAMSADEIVEAIKSHLKLGDISRDEVQKYVAGIKNGQAFARDSSIDLANSIKDPLSEVPSFAGVAASDATTLMANGIQVGSQSVTFAAGSLAAQVWSDLTGKDYTETGAVIPAGMLEGMGDGLAVVLKAAGLGDDVIAAIMEALDAHSPSRRAKAAGETVPAGLAQGIEGSDAPGNAASKLGGTVIEALGDFVGGLFGIGEASGSDFASGVGSQSENANAQGSAVAGRASDGLGTGDGATPGSVIGSAFSQALGGQSGNANAQGAKTAGSAVGGLGTGDGATPGASLGGRFAAGVGGVSARPHGERVANSAGGGMQSQNANAGSWGNHLVQNFAAGISGMVGWARSAASAVAGAVANILGHTVPKEGPLSNHGKGEAEWGGHAVQNFARGMESKIPELEKTVGKVSETAAAGMRDASLGAASLVSDGLRSAAMAPMSGASAASLSVAHRIENAAESSVIDDGSTGRIIAAIDKQAEAIAKMSVHIDGKPAGRVLAPYVNKEIGAIQTRGNR